MLKSSSLHYGVDCGAPIEIDPKSFIASGRDTDWSKWAENFLSFNREAFEGLQLRPRIASNGDRISLLLEPGLRVGAVPLRSAVSGEVTGGVVIRPRFGWTGIGHVLSKTGWGSEPQFLNLPMVPGSGREIPPWVIAGPVLARLRSLLDHLRHGYVQKEETRTQPRGTILWSSYIRNQLATGKWHHLPCRYSELSGDNRLREAIRWTLERLHVELSSVGTSDAVALGLIGQLMLMLERVSDVVPRRPTHNELYNPRHSTGINSPLVQDGIRAMGWVADERGLGGGRSSDGLSWAMPLEVLWERYVESVLREQTFRTGGSLRTGRQGETVIPLVWSDTSHRAIGHLIPDFVIQHHDRLEVVDAKYKSHFAELDAAHWLALAEESQASMRADIHQILAYSAVAGESSRIESTLVYPVSSALHEELERWKKDQSCAEIAVGHRRVVLRVKALPFGQVR